MATRKKPERQATSTPTRQPLPEEMQRAAHQVARIMLELTSALLIDEDVAFVDRCFRLVKSRQAARVKKGARRKGVK